MLSQAAVRMHLLVGEGQVVEDWVIRQLPMLLLLLLLLPLRGQVGSMAPEHSVSVPCWGRRLPALLLLLLRRG